MIVLTPAPALTSPIPVTWCAPTELLDPTPHLTSGAVVLTTGMGMAFRDPRTWAAYAERLSRARVAGLVFSLGPVHAEVPAGLLQACADQGLPLLALSPNTPLLQVTQSITERLENERLLELNRGWQLANECTRLITAGEGLHEVLRHVASDMGGSAAVLDDADVVLEEALDVQGDANSRPGRTGRTFLRLPSSNLDVQFRLAVTGLAPGALVQPRLGPVAAVIGMLLASTLTSLRPIHSDEVARLVEHLRRGQSVSAKELHAQVDAAGFDRSAGWAVARLTTSPGTSRAVLRTVMLRARAALNARVGLARVAEDASGATVLVQARSMDERTSLTAEKVLDAVAVLLRLQDRVRAGVLLVDTLDELSIAVRMADRLMADETGPLVQLLPPLDLAGVVEAMPQDGLRRLAERLLEGLQDEAGDLRTTLECWLRCCGRTREVCDELFIHRNTLAYRMRAVQALLPVDLRTGEGRALCLLALRIVNPGPG